MQIFYKYSWNELQVKSNVNFITEFANKLMRPRFKTIITQPNIEIYFVKENPHQLFSPNYMRYPNKNFDK